MLEWIFASIEFRNPNLLERINRRVGGCNGERCHGTSRRRSEVVGQGLAIDLGLEVGSGQDFFRAPLQIFFFIFRGLGWIFFCYFFSPDIYILLDFEPACSQVTHEP